MNVYSLTANKYIVPILFCKIEIRLKEYLYCQLFQIGQF